MKILVIALAGIGDCLIATPLIHELRLHYPEAVLDAFVFWQGSKDLLDDNPHLNTVYQKNLIQAGNLKAFAYLSGLRRQKYDLTVNIHTQGPIHYRIVARIIGAPERLTHRYECHGWLDNLLITRTMPQDYEIHSVENNLRLLELLDRKPQLPNHEMEVFLAPSEVAWAEEFIRQHRLESRRRLGIHVGSGSTKNLSLKRWPLGHYIDLLQRLTRAHPDLAILLFGGPDEAEAHAKIIAAVGNRSVFPPTTRNLREAAALMPHCHSFLSVDTALMHLAAAMKVPNQIVIEAPTLNKTNLPWHTGYRVIPNPMVNGRNLEYYRYDGGPIRGTREHLLACMASVKVEEVYAAVAEALAQ